MNKQFPRTITLSSGVNYTLGEPHQRMQQDASLANITLNLDLDLDEEDYPDDEWSIFDLALLFQIHDTPHITVDDLKYIYKEIFGKDIKTIGSKFL